MEGLSLQRPYSRGRSSQILMFSGWTINRIAKSNPVELRLVVEDLYALCANFSDETRELMVWLGGRLDKDTAMSGMETRVRAICRCISATMFACEPPATENVLNSTCFSVVDGLDVPLVVIGS